MYFTTHPNEAKQLAGRHRALLWVFGRLANAAHTSYNKRMQHDKQSYPPDTLPRETPGPDMPPPKPPHPSTFNLPKLSRRTWAVIACVAGTVLVVAIMALVLTSHHTVETPPTPTTSQNSNPDVVQEPGLQLDPGKNYGDKYASGILPVGDGKYSSTAPKQGSVYTCSQYAKNLMNDKGGAQTRGPWFVNNNTQYDLNKKSHVQGSVLWRADFSNDVSGGTRTITTNDLPAHPTGIFPILGSDPVYAYDRNPNSIKGQSLTYTLAASPTYGSPACTGGEVGVMLTGVALFNAFDAGGRDAGAWEVQDACSGHPQNDGVYHYHTLSTCIKDTSVHSVVGYALDGFPITGPRVGSKNLLTTGDLDECHGITSQVNKDGKSVTTYHYVMTQDFPYSVSCFHGSAIESPDLKTNAPPPKPQ
jgi:YHYH protein